MNEEEVGKLSGRNRLWLGESYRVVTDSMRMLMPPTLAFLPRFAAVLLAFHLVYHRGQTLIF